MKFEAVVSILLVCLCSSAAIKRSGFLERSNPTTRAVNFDMEYLTSIYDLKDFALGPLKFTVSFGTCDNSIASSCLLVYDNVCGLWTEFRKERLIIWHKGKVMIDMVGNDGTVNTVCLGDTLDDENCRYLVHIPAGKKSNFMPDSSAIVSGLVVGGNLSDGKVLSIDEMKSLFPHYGNMISKSSICYTQ